MQRLGLTLVSLQAQRARLASLYYAAEGIGSISCGNRPFSQSRRVCSPKLALDPSLPMGRILKPNRNHQFTIVEPANDSSFEIANARLNCTSVVRDELRGVSTVRRFNKERLRSEAEVFHFGATRVHSFTFPAHTPDLESCVACGPESRQTGTHCARHTLPRCPPAPAHLETIGEAGTPGVVFWRDTDRDHLSGSSDFSIPTAEAGTLVAAEENFSCAPSRLHSSLAPMPRFDPETMPCKDGKTIGDHVRELMVFVRKNHG
jgi:hypothetical protein